MNEMNRRELVREAADLAVRDVLGPNAHQRARRAMQEAIAEQVTQMTRDGRAFLLTDEEERLIKSFRRFKAKMRKHGEVFKWQTRMLDPSIDPARAIVAEATSEDALIRDPQDVSA